MRHWSDSAAQCTQPVSKGVGVAGCVPGRSILPLPLWTLLNAHQWTQPHIVQPLSDPPSKDYLWEPGGGATRGWQPHEPAPAPQQGPRLPARKVAHPAPEYLLQGIRAFLSSSTRTRWLRPS